MATTFTRMDQSTPEQWSVIMTETLEHQPKVAEQVLAMLRQLEDITVGFAVDQLTHCLQTATRAERAGASDEVVIACLCHDIGKVVSIFNHDRIAAEILEPYVSEDTYLMIRTHQDFQGAHYYEYLGGDAKAREQHRQTLTPEQFELAARFADEWDQTAFDPDYDTLPLEHFEDRLRQLFAVPKALGG